MRKFHNVSRQWMCLKPRDLLCLSLESVKYTLHQFFWSAIFPWRCPQVSCRENTRWNCHDLIVGVSSDQWVRIVTAAAGAGTIRGVTGLSVPGDSLPLSAGVSHYITDSWHAHCYPGDGRAKNINTQKIEKNKKWYEEDFLLKMILFSDSSFT